MRSIVRGVLAAAILVCIPGCISLAIGDNSNKNARTAECTRCSKDLKPQLCEDCQKETWNDACPECKKLGEGHVCPACQEKASK